MKGLRLAMIVVVALGICLVGTFIPQGTATALTAAHTSVSAPTSAITLIAEAGFNGYIKQGSWTPVYITLGTTDPSDGDLALSITPDRSRLYSAPVTMARGARKQLTLYAPPTVNPIQVLYLNNGQVMAATTPPIHTLDEADRLVLIVSDPADGLNFLNDLHTPFGGKTYVAQLTPDQIPEHTTALDSADVLIFNNIDTLSLNDAQRAAIRAWVLGGGHLILGGGPGARLTAGGFNDFAPARVGATVQNSPVGILRQLLVPNTVDATSVISTPLILSSATSTSTALIAPVVVLQPAADDTRSLISSRDTPLVMRRDLGRGTVDQLAFDPTLAPIRDWPDRRMIFAGLLGGSIGVPMQAGPLRAEKSALIAARALPGAALPPFLILAAFLLLYVLTIGPINFFFLRKLNRLAWAWVTIPATVVLFAVIGYATGFRLRGNEPEVHRLSIISGDAQVTDGRVQSILGIFSPRHTTLDISTGNALAQEIEPNPNIQNSLSFRFSSPNQLQKVAATNNDVRSFYLQGEASLPSIQADLQFIPGNTLSERARITGELHNESNAALKNCVFFVGKDYNVIGNIAPNEHLKVDSPLLFGRPQMGFAIPYSRLTATGYASSLGTTFGHSDYASSAPQSYHSPFDMDGSSLAESILNWRDYRDDRLQEQAERGLVTAIFYDPDARVGYGVNLACWEAQDRLGIQVNDASYTDQGLRIWHLPVRPFLARSGTVLPADAFVWNVLSSSSNVAMDENGLDMEVGDHIISFTPWLSTRASGPVSVTLNVEANPNTPMPTLLGSSIWLYDWKTLQFTQVPAGISISNEETETSGAYLSPAGELRMRVNVREGPMTLTNIQAKVQVP